MTLLRNFRSLKEENAKINSLESEVERLTNLIKEQKVKIINTYTHFFNEKELLKELINAYLEYGKAKKQKLPAVRLKRHKENAYNELMKKMDEEAMEEVEIILNYCEELIHYEAELQVKINNNQKLIADSQQTSNKLLTKLTILTLV